MNQHDPGRVEASPGSRAFTNFQWYFSNSRNTVFFGAFTREPMTEAGFHSAVQAALFLAPQLNWHQDERGNRHVDVSPFAVASIAAFREVDSLEGFPDKVLLPHTELFDDPTLPCFRAYCFALKRGSRDGHRAFVLFQTSHALMEGADSSALVRGLTSVHELGPKKRSAGLAARLGTSLAAAVLAPANLLMARFHQGHLKQSTFRTMTIDRNRLKLAATRFGVQQRSILFGAVLYGMFYQGLPQRAGGKAKLIGYTKLPLQRFTGDDDFMKLRVHMARVKSAVCLEEYVKALDGLLDRENKNAVGMQMLYNNVLGVHKRLQRLMPFAYDRKFFSFVPYDFVFSLVPPHLETGRFAGLRFDEIFCGTYTPGANTAIMVPYRDGLSLTFWVDEKMRSRLGAVAAVLAEIGIPARTWGEDRGVDGVRSPAVA